MTRQIEEKLTLLVPNAEYFGVLYEETKAAYDALEWKDSRPKPPWEIVLKTKLPIAENVYRAATQVALNTKAVEKGYFSIESAVSYAADQSNPIFQQDGQAFLTWRSAVWAKAFELLTDMKSGLIDQMEIDAFVAELPKFD